MPKITEITDALTASTIASADEFIVTDVSDTSVHASGKVKYITKQELKRTMLGVTASTHDNSVAGGAASIDLVTVGGTQTLAAKTLTSPTITTPTITDPDITGGTIRSAEFVSPTMIAPALDSNTTFDSVKMSDILAAVPTKTGAETLTNKTITSPAINGGTITGGAISGGTISNTTTISATSGSFHGLTVAKAIYENATLSTCVEFDTASNTTDNVTAADIFTALSMSDGATALADATTHNILAKSVTMNLYTESTNTLTHVAIGISTNPTAVINTSGSGSKMKLVSIDLASLSTSTKYRLVLSFKLDAVV